MTHISHALLDIVRHLADWAMAPALQLAIQLGGWALGGWLGGQG